ncbi:protein-L-isoaspartate O-methyltransferase [Rhodotorula diobovata]|uniref:protein-L-isoaspartate(D-aspartate) O-methyltransferase n=1 Tax=Rhodotorula diobovata TaxID=5288 RepID=A0A5C5G4N2_9BASI|nr:protein-L-isoaspartate O-methyltransferase [Rhodotorula diobovata]
MAWRCSGRSNDHLVDNLAHAGILSTPRVIDAFKRTDRKYYVNDPSDAYVDSPAYLSHGATISAPHMHANAVENLEPFLQPGANVLDIGSGSGYLLPIFHSLVQPLGTVLGIDHVPALVDLARANLAADPLARDLLAPEGGDKGAVQCLVGDGREGAPKGWVPEGGWQAIHVGAAAPSLPSPLLSQLASPGRMFIPLGTDDQAIYQVDKDAEGRVTETRLYGVRYVPLTDRETQAPGGRA